MDYTTMTVKQLKDLCKERDVILFSPKRKEDYVNGLVEKDDSDRSKFEFQQSLTQSVGDIQNALNEIEERAIEIEEKKKKINDACNVMDAQIKTLKDKDDKTIDDYKELVKLMEKRMKFMKDVI